MNKVICDVCGTDYPETAAQCPICGCATAGSQTVTGGADSAEEVAAPYTYVKGGRFSKANVKKRLKASQQQESRIVAPEPDDTDEDVDVDAEVQDQDQEETSNRGLVIIVVLLLLAIIAVSAYIAVSIFGVGSDDRTPTGNPVVQTPPANTEGTERVACTSLVLRNLSINLQNEGEICDLVVTAEPLNTTDTMTFVSSNESVAVVDQKTGRVKAVGAGEAVITVKCGDVTVECPVSCVFVSEPTEDNNTTDATEVTDPTQPNDGFVLELRKSDFTLFSAGETYLLYKGTVNASEITWTSDDESIATIKDGVVTAVAPGSTRVNGEYNGQKVVCWVRCKFKVEEPTEEPTESTEDTEATEGTEATEDTQTTPTTDPTDPAEESYVLRKNGARCPYGDDYYAEATIKVGESFKLTVVNSENVAQDVEWNLSEEGVCAINGTRITGMAEGRVKMTASYKGQTFECVLIVR